MERAQSGLAGASNVRAAMGKPPSTLATQDDSCALRKLFDRITPKRRRKRADIDPAMAIRSARCMPKILPLAWLPISDAVWLPAVGRDIDIANIYVVIGGDDAKNWFRIALLLVG